MHPSTRDPGDVSPMLNYNATVSAVFGKGWLRPRVARSDWPAGLKRQPRKPKPRSTLPTKVLSGLTNYRC